MIQQIINGETLDDADVNEYIFDYMFDVYEYGDFPQDWYGEVFPSKGALGEHMPYGFYVSDGKSVYDLCDLDGEWGFLNVLAEDDGFYVFNGRSYANEDALLKAMKNFMDEPHDYMVKRDDIEDFLQNDFDLTIPEQRLLVYDDVDDVNDDDFVGWELYQYYDGKFHLKRPFQNGIDNKNYLNDLLLQGKHQRKHHT